MISHQQTLRWIPLFCIALTVVLAAVTHAAAPKKIGNFPRASASYNDDQITSLPAKLISRIQEEPFNLVGTIIFVCAIIHTFLASTFQKLAHDGDIELKRLEESLPPEQRRWDWPNRDRILFRTQVFHFMGEVEAVFGIWLLPLIGAIVLYKGWSAMVDYVGHAEVTEAVFVVVVMAISSSLPVLRLAENLIARVSALGKGTPAAWWLAVLTLGPLLGSFITEPAAMTICALILRHRFYHFHPSNRLKYATLGLLFVNISVGGTLSHFAAPPVVMAATAWNWDLAFMASNFGWKATIGILVSNLIYFVFFRREFSNLAEAAAAQEEDDEEETPVPWPITLIHILFLAWTVANAHYAVLTVLGFLFFMAFVAATRSTQQPVALRPPLLVGFFLAALVIHGGFQQWWIAPVLKSLSTIPLMIGSTVLTAFNDNAAITYLASLVPDFPHASQYAVMAGAVAGGGLTVIANAPNPAGQSILGSRFGPGGISPLGLFLGALLPTIIVGIAFMAF
ncbi:MAG: putative Na+/H+ antiporter [Verrucomicrobia bacterium]|nr:putative Na+/H+ antiporter [Verrucomicrobiota bacterium]